MTFFHVIEANKHPLKFNMKLSSNPWFDVYQWVRGRFPRLEMVTRIDFHKMSVEKYFQSRNVQMNFQ